MNISGIITSQTAMRQSVLTTNNTNEKILVKTSDDKLPKPCSDYNTSTGKCKSSGKYCDACYGKDGS